MDFFAYLFNLFVTTPLMKIPFTTPKIPNFREMSNSERKQWVKNHKKEILILIVSLAALVTVFVIGLKNIAVVLGLILLGAGSELFVRYTGFYLGNVFTLFSTIVAAYLFGPWIGVLTVAAIYVVLTLMPGEEPPDYPVGAWYAITAIFFLPKIGFDNILTLKLLFASMIGEAGNIIYWSLRFEPTWQIIMGVAKMFWYLFLLVYVLPSVVAFVG